MELTKEKALELHRQMWTDMQRELGNNPESREREKFKEEWCEQHFPGEEVSNHCFLCEQSERDCDKCLIVWPNENSGLRDFYCCRICGSDMNAYNTMPISRLLSLPEREDE